MQDDSKKGETSVLNNEPSAPLSKKKSKKNIFKRVIIFVLIIVLLIALAGLGWYLTRQPGSQISKFDYSDQENRIVKSSKLIASGDKDGIIAFYDKLIASADQQKKGELLIERSVRLLDIGGQEAQRLALKDGLAADEILTSVNSAENLVRIYGIIEDRPNQLKWDSILTDRQVN